MSLEHSINKVVFHPRFNDVVFEISKLNIKLPPPISQQDFDFTQGSNGVSVMSEVEKESIISLDPLSGSISPNIGRIAAYDESKNKYMALEGTAALTSHSVIFMSEKEYIPSNLITFNFYTRSKVLAESGSFIKYSEDPDSDSNRDYHEDRNNFLLNVVPKNAILLVDGPFIGEQATSFTLKLNRSLLEKGIIPLFFVKNSNSNLVVSNIKELKGKYNSDLHWANKVLKPGQRTCLFTYIDKYNPQNTKLFCYIKVFDATAQRIELHPETYKKFSKLIPDLMNMIYYLMLVQGNPMNPQVRPIAIAEIYARSTLTVLNFTKTMGQLGITPTMNQSRGFTQG